MFPLPQESLISPLRSDDKILFASQVPFRTKSRATLNNHIKNYHTKIPLQPPMRTNDEQQLQHNSTEKLTK